MISSKIPGNFVANTEFLSSKFGKKPQTSIDDGLEQTISWSNKN